MKANNMRAPVVSELFHQKQVYQLHLNKLQKIREQRKQQLISNNTYLTKHLQIRQTKSRSFAHRYNEEHSEISQSNRKLMKKLENVKPFTRYTSISSYSNQAKEQRSVSPFVKRRLAETDRQNNRIFHKIKAISSSLSKEKQLEDFSRSQRIKTRITRYATENNKITLKSSRYVNLGNLAQQQSRIAPHSTRQPHLLEKIKNISSEHKNIPEENQGDLNESSHSVFPTEVAKSHRSRLYRKYKS